MTGIEKKLRQLIARDGAVDIATFMDMAVSHYYATRDPFGAGGDFTTAPEISQMFGEMIGAWAADVWIRLGRPAKIMMIEAGPGRGTLMQDVMRATKTVKGFHEAVRLVLLETSPVLKDAQMGRLAQYEPAWISTLNHPIVRSDSCPVIFIANEFLDALPVAQYEWRGDTWQERVVKLDGERLVFDFRPVKNDTVTFILSGRSHLSGISEISKPREDFVAQVARLVKGRKGAALFIDYGHVKSGTGDTLQALKKHKYVPVLEGVGESDLTSHVDFSVFGFPVVTQKEFLEKLGIKARAQALLKAASGKQADDIQAALQRLTDKNQMGDLFKVMVIE